MVKNDDFPVKFPLNHSIDTGGPKSCKTLRSELGHHDRNSRALKVITGQSWPMAMAAMAPFYRWTS